MELNRASTVTEFTLTVLTLNCWGIVGISKDRVERIRAIAEVLATGRYDFVCLQELWSEDDYNDITQQVEKVLPYTHYFYSGVTGSGLSILSKYPFESFMFHQWSVNGYMHKIFHGDWFGGKGIGLCRISVRGLSINLYTTHLHAQYSEEDEYLAHRVVQAFDTAQFVDLTSGAAHFSILAGDLNTQPGELCHQLIQHTAHLHDSYEKHAEDSSLGTYDCKRNSYADQKLVSQNPNGQRIDHILYRPGLGTKVDLVKYMFPLPERVPGKSFSYSDHEAIAATFKITPPTNHSLADHAISNRTEMITCLREGTAIVTDAVRDLYYTRMRYWSITSAIVFGLLMMCLFTDVPSNYTRTFQLALVVLTAVSIFCFVMATVWNNIEQNALRSSVMSMQFLADRASSADGQGDATFVSGALS
uniref:sphingomyelin phosphodiesterase n=1 Tax=Nephotettix cincticeps TaxID=94400 RepID=A0A7T7P1G7_NEPCI|nr:neutral sphingomyelinase [Nephotettix cincticeps]